MTRDLEADGRTAQIAWVARENDDLFRLLVQHAPDIVVVTDIHGTILYASPSVERILGYRTDEYIGTNGRSYIHPDDLDRIMEEFRAVAMRPGLHTQPVTWRHCHADGSWRVLEGLANNLLAHPEVHGIVYNAHDVTHASRLNEAVRRQTSILRGQAELLDLANDAILVHDRRTAQVLYWNEGAEKMYGWMKGEALGKHVHDLLQTASPIPLEHIEQNLLTSDRWEGELTQTRSDGTPIVVSSRWTLRWDDGGEATAILQVNFDITAQKRTEEALRQSEAEFRSIFEQAGAGIARLNLEGELLNVNPALGRLLGLERDELIGRTLADFTHPDDRTGPDLYAELIAGQHDSYQVEQRFLHKDGHSIWMLLTITLVRDSTSRPRYAVCLIEEITKRKATEDQLAHRALHDPLTDLPNRVLLRHRLTQALASSADHQRSVGVLFLDLDRFKTVNDEFGHATGDALLVAAATRIRGCLRSEDTAARLGGDEFVVIIPDITGIEDAVPVAQRMIGAMQTPFKIEDVEARVGTSIGIALSDSETNDAEELLRRADWAMYQAKRAGRGRWQEYRSPGRTTGDGRNELETDLVGALDRGEFRVQIEPDQAPGSGDLVGHTARLYWEHPQRGPLESEQFMPIAAALGISTVIELWLLEMACRQMRGWREWHSGSQTLAMCVSLSAHCLTVAGLADKVERLLVETGLSPHQLVIQVTDAPPPLENEVAGAMHDLTRLGLRVQGPDRLSIVC